MGAAALTQVVEEASTQEMETAGSTQVGSTSNCKVLRDVDTYQEVEGFTQEAEAADTTKVRRRPQLRHSNDLLQEVLEDRASTPERRVTHHSNRRTLRLLARRLRT